jgi:hypothetical protein
MANDIENGHVKLDLSIHSIGLWNEVRAVVLLHPHGTHR